MQLISLSVGTAVEPYYQILKLQIKNNKNDNVMKKISYLPLIVAGLILLPACEDDEGTDTADLQLSINGLPSLDDFHTYEGWLIVDGSAVSTGKFSVDDNGTLSQTSFSVDAGNLNNASEFVLTIEPDPDNSESPTDIHLLAGSFIGNSATLSIGHEAAIGTGFSSVVGKYILATPSNGDDSDELSGIWWLAPSGPSAGLQLPSLNDGWLYEGWVVINGTPVSTGKFSEVDMEDMSARYSATLDTPPFPGEDFLTNAPAGLSFPTDLSGERAVISVEPDPDNSDSPFAIKPLVGDIPSDATDHTLYSMSDNTDAINITGEAIR
jgi:hypothetical protein